MDLAGPKKPSEVAPGDVIGYVLANVDSALARQAQASAGRQQGAAKKEKQEESSSEDDEDYPPEPQRCLVSGPGFAGTNAGQPVKLVVDVRDVRGKRMKEGGEEVDVRVQATGMGGTSQHVECTVVDNENGTYTATYTPANKGNYLVAVEVNGVPIAGSPFPVFFSTPLDPAEIAAQQEAERLARAQAEAAASHMQPVLTAANPAISAAAAAGLAAANSVNTADEPLRTLYIADISNAVPLERLRELFAIFGQVQDLTVVGDRKDMAIVIFTTKEAAQQAQALHQTQFGDRQLRVTAPIAAMSIGVVPSDPGLAMQMQQIQQMQTTLQQSQKLAQQVAQMRALARTGGFVREDPMKAAEEAAARLARKFGGGGSGGTGPATGLGAELAAAAAAAAAAAVEAKNSARERKAGMGRSRSRSRSRSPRRRSRSRSRDRRERERRERERERERERAERERRERERARERELARERERERERQRERERERRRRSRSRSRSPDRKDRDKDRDRRDKDSSRDNDRDRDRDRKSRDKDREKEKERDREKDRDRKDRDKKEKDKDREKDRKDKDKDRRDKDKKSKDKDKEAVVGEDFEDDKAASKAAAGDDSAVVARETDDATKTGGDTEAAGDGHASDKGRELKQHKGRSYRSKEAREDEEGGDEGAKDMEEEKQERGNSKRRDRSRSRSRSRSRR